jgi:hypothetical protein
VGPDLRSIRLRWLGLEIAVAELAEGKNMNAQWGTFTKPYKLNTCLTFASDAMQKQGYQIWDTAGDGDYMVIGGTGDVIVNVTCVPQQGNTWIAVSAYSTDPSAAENARNTVRQTIVEKVLID